MVERGTSDTTGKRGPTTCTPEVCQRPRTGQGLCCSRSGGRAVPLRTSVIIGADAAKRMVHRVSAGLGIHEKPLIFTDGTLIGREVPDAKDIPTPGAPVATEKPGVWQNELNKADRWMAGRLS